MGSHSRTTITLPWPPRALWPNSRIDRRYSGDTRRAFKDSGFYAAKEAKAKPAEHLAITFCPPTRGRRDLDNMLSAIKYGLDGIAAAVGQDDSEWSLSLERGEPVKGGAVLVELRGPIKSDFKSIGELAAKLVEGHGK